MTRSRWISHPAAPALLCWLVFGLVDGAISSTRQGLLEWNFRVAALDQGVRLLVWLTLAALMASLPRPMRRVFVVALAATLSVTTVSAAGIYGEFGEYLSVGMLNQVISDIWSGMAGYFAAYLTPLSGVCLAAVAGAVAAIWWPAASRSGSLSLRALGATPFLVFAFLFSLNQLHLRAGQSRTGIETSALLAFKRNIAFRGERVLYRSSSRGRPQAFETTEPPWNVLIVLVESWAKPTLLWEEGGQPGLRFFREWSRQEGARMVEFPHGFSSSSDTRVSVPSIMTGISPERSVEDLHRAPFVWDWLSASGYSSTYVTGQKYRWCGFHEFFFTRFPGTTVSADSLNAPLANDLGVDDLLSSQHFVDVFAMRPKDRPFFAVYNPNALHSPGQKGSPLMPEAFPEHYSRPMRSMRVVDRAIENVIRALDAEKELERTFVIFTGDHGTSLSKDRDRIPRLYSHRESVVSIPMFLRVPQRWIDRNPQSYRTLLSNRERNVSNIDLLPTVLDLVGARQPLENEPWLRMLSGQSLLRPLPRDRVLYAVFPIRKERKGSKGVVVVIQDQLRLVISTVSGRALYDLKDDPAQAINRWSDPRYDDARNALLAHVTREPELDRIARVERALDRSHAATPAH